MKKKILICDDETDTYLLMKAALHNFEFDFIYNTNGEEALETVKQEKPDLIVMDYMLPRMDGFETITEIRKLNLDIPVIFITALNVEPDLRQKIEAVVDVYLVKPFEYTELIDAVEKTLKNG